MDGTSLSAAASTLATLLAILLLLAGAAYLARRLRAQLPGGTTKTQGDISIISSRALGGQNTLIVAETQGQRFLIGISRNGMTALGRLPSHD